MERSVQRILKLIASTIFIAVSASSIIHAEDLVKFENKVELHQYLVNKIEPDEEGYYRRQAKVRAYNASLAAATMKDAIKKCDRSAYETAKIQFEAAGGISSLTLPGSNEPDFDPFTSSAGAFLDLNYPTSLCNPPTTFLSAGARIGSINRGRSSFFRTELGGVVLRNPHFTARRDSEDFKAVDLSGGIYNFLPLAPLFDPLGIFDDNAWDLFSKAVFGISSTGRSVGMLSAGGNQLAILSPAGPAGALGGGAVTAPGFGDIDGLRYDDNYSEGFFSLGARNSITVDAGPNAIIISPRVSAFYGFVDERSSLSGMTNAGTFPFRYDNKIKTDRVGLELGGEVKLQMPNGYGFYIEGDARFIHNEADGISQLSAGPFIPEIGRDSISFNDFGGVIGAGIVAETSTMRGRLGVQYETWKIPSLNVPGTREMFLTRTDRSSLSVRGELIIYLAPQLVNPDE